jgi:chromosome partitioning protein
LSEAPSFGETILTYSPGSAGALAYAALTEELLAREK